MQQSSKKRKRRPEPEELPSFATLEVISVALKNGRVTQERVVEKVETDYDLPLALGFLGDDSASLFVDPQTVPQPSPDAPKGSPSGAPSRSVSVGDPCLPRRHSLTPLPDQSRRVDPTPVRVPSRTPSPGSSPS
jgi:hypothetical protein